MKGILLALVLVTFLGGCKNELGVDRLLTEPSIRPMCIPEEELAKMQCPSGTIKVTVSRVPGCVMEWGCVRRNFL